MILGIALLIFGVSLAVTALLLALRMRTVVVAGSDDLAVLRGRQSRSVPWSTSTRSACGVRGSP